MGHGRRKSHDSSDSSSSSDSSDSEGGYKAGKVKKDKKHKKDKKNKTGHGEPVHFGASGAGMMPLMPDMNMPGHRIMPGIPPAVQHATSAPHQAPPASGYRIPLHASASFPEAHLAGTVPCHDLDGSPVFFGSALFDKSVHPCKVAPRLSPMCHVSFGGREVGHTGRFDLLPFDSSSMELVHASRGHLPQGRRAVEGGYEENGAALYHGVATHNGTRVPGKVGTHLGGCNFAFGGGEHVTHDYELLCWK